MMYVHKDHDFNVCSYKKNKFTKCSHLLINNNVVLFQKTSQYLLSQKILPSEAHVQSSQTVVWSDSKNLNLGLKLQVLRKI